MRNFEKKEKRNLENNEKKGNKLMREKYIKCIFSSVMGAGAQAAGALISELLTLLFFKLQRPFI